MSLDNVLYELRHEGASTKLKHIEDVSDRSQPAIEPGTHVHRWDKDGLLKEIETGLPLKHVDDLHDRSSPRVEGVQLHPSDRPALLAEVKAVGGHHAVVSELKATCEAGGPALAHVDAPADRSAPAVKDAHVGKWDKDAFLHEIESPKELKHVDHVSDRSEPLVEADVQLKRNMHGQLLTEIKSSSPEELRHVEVMADRSEPQLTQTAALRVHGPTH